MLKIGEFSKLAKTTIKTLRFYDDINLFKPVFVDENGYRYYDYDQLNDLIKILEYRSLDLPIEKIIDIMNGSDRIKILNEHIDKLKEDLVLKTNQINSLKKILMGDENNMDYQIKEKTIKEQIVYFKHGVIKSMDDIFDFVLQAGSECGKLNPTLKYTDYCYITYTANEYKEKDIELEYIEACETFGNESDNIKFRKEKEEKVLSIESYGSYSNLRNAYAYILGYIDSNNLKITGPLREVYIHGCWDTEDESKYLTEIQVPIK